MKPKKLKINWKTRLAIF